MLVIRKGLWHFKNVNMGINNKTLLNKLTVMSVLMMQNTHIALWQYGREPVNQHEILFTQELKQLGCATGLARLHTSATPQPIRILDLN